MPAKEIGREIFDIPLVKCVLCHEEFDDGNLLFCIDVAVDLLSRGIDLPEVYSLAAFFGDNNSNYFELKEKVRGLIRALKINPPHGKLAADLYVLCKIEQMTSGLIAPEKCLQLIGDMLRNVNGAFVIENIMDYYWNQWSDNPSVANKAISDFLLDANRIKKVVFIDLSNNGIDEMRDVMIKRTDRA